MNIKNTNQLMKLLNKAIKHFGDEAQVEKTIEEMAELTMAIQKFKLFVKSESSSTKEMMEIVGNVVEEIADVTIMMQQMTIMFDVENVNNAMDYKLGRLQHRIENGNDTPYNPNQTKMFGEN